MCPNCGTVNDAESMFCASCGSPLRMGSCPNCGSEIDPEADFCEVCHKYIKKNVCSFCGAQMSESEVYCHECGNPRGGIVCPMCNTLNDFSFCKQCGTPLTQEAKMLVADMKKRPDYQMLVEAARELEDLEIQIPYSSERDVVRDQMNDKLRERVLMLLAKDKGVQNPTIPSKNTRKISQEELTKRKDEKIQGTGGIAHGTEDAAAHVIDEKTGDTAQVDAQIHRGLGKHILRRAHEAQERSYQQHTQH